MSRIVKPEQAWHRIRLRCDRRNGELVLSGTGRNAYLWAGPDSIGQYSDGITTYSGAVALRKLARTILRVVPAPKRRRP